MLDGFGAYTDISASRRGNVAGLSKYALTLVTLSGSEENCASVSSGELFHDLTGVCGLLPNCLAAKEFLNLLAAKVANISSGSFT